MSSISIGYPWILSLTQWLTDSLALPSGCYVHVIWILYSATHLCVSLEPRSTCFLCSSCNKVVDRRMGHRHASQSGKEETSASKKSALKWNKCPEEHTGEKPFKCEICRREFKTSCTLTRHMRTHTGEKPFKCEMCRKEFSDSSNLARHMLTHTREKPFKCKVCHKKYKSTGDLTRHMRTHTGEKPYKCERCHKGFNTPSSMVKHMRTHTNTWPAQERKLTKCKICNKISSSLQGSLDPCFSHITIEPWRS